MKQHGLEFVEMACPPGDDPGDTPEGILAMLYDYSASGLDNLASDLVIDAVDTFLGQGDHEKVDAVLRLADASRLSRRAVTALTMETHRADHMLPARGAFLAGVNRARRSCP